MSKFTAEEVRDYADACRLLHKGPVIADMLTAYAERIKADERAVPVAWISHFHIVGLPNKDYYDKLPIQSLQPGVYSHTPLFTHPPAQSAQVAGVHFTDAKMLAINHKQAVKIQELQTKLERLTVAEPVVQGEVVPPWVDALAEKWACCIAADHLAGPALKQCASELLDAAYGRNGPPYSFVYGLGRAQPRAVPDEASDAELMAEWFSADGSVHGLHVETVTMPQAKYLTFRRSITQPAERVAEDTALLDAIQHNSWDLCCFDHTDGEDVGWRVIEHYMAESRERVIAEVFEDNPRYAVKQAMRTAAPSPGESA